MSLNKQHKKNQNDSITKTRNRISIKTVYPVIHHSMNSHLGYSYRIQFSHSTNKNSIGQKLQKMKVSANEVQQFTYRTFIRGNKSSQLQKFPLPHTA